MKLALPAQRARDAAREEKQRERETAQLQEGAALETERLRDERDREYEREPEPRSPREKKSPWKKFMPHRHEREPGRISKIESRGATQDGYSAAMAKTEATVKDSVELTPTGATMAGDGPASFAAPEIRPETEAAIHAAATTPIEEHANGPKRPSTEAAIRAAATTPSEERQNPIAAETSTSHRHAREVEDDREALRKRCGLGRGDGDRDHVEHTQDTSKRRPTAQSKRVRSRFPTG